MKILVLTTAPGSKATKSIVKAGEARKHQMIVKDPRWLYLLISESVNGYDRVYDGYRQEEKPIKLHTSEYDAIIPRIGNNLSYSLAVLEHLNNNLRIFSTQIAPGIRTASDKLISQQKFSQWGLKTPKTILGDEVRHPDWMIKQINGLPSIAKTITGSLGNGVYILESALQTNVFLQNFAKKKNKLLLQSYISSGEVSKDVRAIVIDGRVITAMERTAKRGEIRANIDKGGSGRKIELSEEDQKICIRATQAVGLACAGVDLIKDKEGKTFVIEINGNYGYKVETITKTDISTPLIEFAERSYKKKPNPGANGNNAKGFSDQVQGQESDYSFNQEYLRYTGKETDQDREDKLRSKYEELSALFPATFGNLTFEEYKNNVSKYPG